MIALIMAGGSGTRFWPRSRSCKPKQFLQIIGEQTMIQSTVERIKSKVGSKNIFLVAGENHINQLKDQLPQIPGRGGQYCSVYRPVIYLFKR